MNLGTTTTINELVNAQPPVVFPGSSHTFEDPYGDSATAEQLSETRARGVWDWLLLSVIVCGLPLLIYLTIHNNLLTPLVKEAELHRWQRLLLRPSMLWALMGTMLLVFRSVLWFFYRPFPAADMKSAPFLTVIIPAYNEGAMVGKSIESVAAAHYPKERLEIFVVDDGSTDDTWKYIHEAAERHSDIVTAVRQPRNLGKRAALALGFERARGSVVVTIDSDSVLERNALLAVTGPFRNPKVGAVAGKVVVYNRREGIIPRMLHVRFIVSFDLLRAAESSYGNVFCCPGALTAYRTCAVRQVLKTWAQQKFLGAECTIGEDRAMTNLVLGAGYDTVYQRSAVVHTVVPTTYSKLCKMLLRWDRSYVREELRFLRIVWKRPIWKRVTALFDRVITNLRYPVHYLTMFLLAVLLVGHPWMLVRLFLIVGVFSLFNMMYYLRSEWSFDLYYGVLFSYFEMITMFWIFPYAVLTVRARSWLTR
jgi:hyaluronan synthase